MADTQKTVKIIFEVDGEQQVVQTFEDVAGAAKKAAKETEKAKDEGTAFGALKDKIGGLLKPLKGVVRGMKTLKGALISTGIGAFVVAIGTLIAYFQNSEEGSKKLAIATEALGIIFGKLTDAASKVGEKLVSIFTNPKQALKDFGSFLKSQITNRVTGMLELIPALGKAISLVFQRKFKEAATVAGNAVGKVTLGVENVVEKTVELGQTVVDVYKNEIVPAVNEAVDAATNLVNTQRALRDEQQKLIVDNANLNKELETQQKIAEDTTLTYDERKAALERVGEAQVQLAENLAKQAQLEESLLEQQIAQESNYEKREALETSLAEATASRIDAETALEIKKIEASKITRELDLEEQERKLSIRDILEENAVVIEENAFQLMRDELDRQERAAEEELTRMKASEEEKLALKKSFSDKKKQVDKQEVEFKKMLDAEAKDAILNTASDVFGTLSQIAGEGSAEAKAFAIAQTTIDTYQSANAAYKSVVGIPVVGTTLAPIAAGVAIAGGLLSVKKILSTKLPGGAKESGGSVPSITPPQTPSIDPTQLAADAALGQDTDSTIGIGETTGAAPIRAYVVAEEVTSSQEANKKISDLAKL